MVKELSCDCNPDRLLDGKGHNNCDWSKQILGEVIGNDGRPTGVHRSDALAMLDLAARVESSTELMKLGGPSKDWAIALNKFLDLFDAPHNISELWVWHRFCAAFARGDTWLANDNLDLLMAHVDQLSQLSAQWAKRSKLSVFARYRLSKQIDRAQVRLFSLLGEVQRNLRAWKDASDFATFTGR
jgi:hypothetical protein